MPQPTIQDVHVNVPLTNISLLARQDDEDFVADRVFQTLPVNNRSDVYYTYNKGDFIRNQMAKRGPGTESAGAGYRIDATPSYLCDVWSLHKDIPYQVRANADSMLNQDMEAAMFLSDQARLNRELTWASTFFAGSIWSTELAGVASAPVVGTSVLLWDDAASTPIEDVRYMKRLVQLASLKRPNILTLSRPVFDVLCDHPQFIDRVKGGATTDRPARVIKNLMAALFEVDEVNVMDGIQNTAAEDPASTPTTPTDYTFQFVGGKHALLTYRPPAPGLMTPAAGYTFAWTGFLGASAIATRIKSFEMPWLESTRFEIDNAYVQKVIGKDLGGFFNGVIS